MDDANDAYYAAIIIGAVGLTVLLVVIYFNDIIDFFGSSYNWLANSWGNLVDFNNIWDYVIIAVIAIVYCVCQIFSDKD
ncbi:MAG: hypothetical protein ACTSRG_14505 [Candidatus Helarchaeota archaeon]